MRGLGLLLLLAGCAGAPRAARAPASPPKLAARGSCPESDGPRQPLTPLRPQPPPSAFTPKDFGPEVPIDGTLGAISGAVRSETGAPLRGVTVVATSSVLAGTQAELTDDTGRFSLAALPAGTYEITFYYGELVVERTGLVVRSGIRSSIVQGIDTHGEEVSVDHKVGSIDTQTTRCAELHGRCGLSIAFPGGTVQDPAPTRSSNAEPCD